MSARKFLATPAGVALRQGQRSGRFFDHIGTIIDLVDLVDSIAGGGPGMDIEDILNNHQELLDRILKQQEEISSGIGGINDNIQGIGGDIDQIKDLIGQIGEGQDEARALLESILAEQRRMAREINRNLQIISNQVQGVWTEMNSWFALTITAIAGMADTLAEIQQQLARIEELLEEVLAEIAELHDRVDWNAVISMFAEHEHRVGYCIEMMMAITVLPTDPQREGAGGPALKVDADGLESWARAVTDEVSGLPYSLYCLHRVLVGDTLLGKSLMHVFCDLMAHKEEVGYRGAARYFFKLASVEAQGFAALAKARQAINLPEVDYAGLLRERLLVQTASVNAALESAYGVAEWNDAVTREDWIPYGLRGYVPAVPPEPIYFVVENNRQLIGAIGFPDEPSSVLGESRTAVEFYVGNAVPGSRIIDSASVRTMPWMRGTTPVAAMMLATAIKEENPATGALHKYLRYYPQHFVFDPKYVMVGLRASARDGVTILEPLVAMYDEETGTTSWDGTSGGLWAAVLDESCKPTSVDLGDADRPLDQLPPWQREPHATAPARDHRFTDLRAVGGFRISFKRDGDKMWFRPGLLDDTWEERTMLPANPQSDYLLYEAVDLP
ncbi:hypothetical protein ABT034_17715 [Streptomyces sp. NPDC002773]|uniref:hypothetical protein n=1 Tax=Streptomyces sp. NPDC002773 TaxID=3154430 RepID=UPI003326D031